jgi:hypothetical protein
MAGAVAVYLNSPIGFQRRETAENVETVIYTGTGDYVLEMSGGSRRVYRREDVHKVRMEKCVEFIDQS